ncbi:MAG: YggT family protein [Candidatus Omnitrophica bacterium]|nr:YggT family protein [Candidatus Omnitrophota bacterium]
MGILGDFFAALGFLVQTVLSMLYILIIARALVSWVSPDPYNPIVQFLYRTTEPLLAPFRRFLPRTAIDISPILAILTIMFLQIFLERIFARLVIFFGG